MLMRYMSGISEELAEIARVELEAKKALEIKEVKINAVVDEVMSEGLFTLPNIVLSEGDILFVETSSNTNNHSRSTSVQLLSIQDLSPIDSVESPKRPFVEDNLTESESVPESSKRHHPLKLEALNLQADQRNQDAALEESAKQHPGFNAEPNDVVMTNQAGSVEEEGELQDSEEEGECRSINSDKYDDAKIGYRHTCTIFLVPTVPLVTQQANYIRSNSNLRTSQIWGGMRKTSAHKVFY